MNLDVRLPIGLMFTLFGVLLTAHGALGGGAKTAQHPLGWNINLYWGLVLLVFGLFMLFLVNVGRRKG